MRKFSLIAFIALAFINKAAWGMDDTGMCATLCDGLPTSAVSRIPVEPSPFRLLDKSYSAIRGVGSFLKTSELAAFMNSKKTVAITLYENMKKLKAPEVLEAIAYIQELPPGLSTKIETLSETQQIIVARGLKIWGIKNISSQYKKQCFERLDSVSANHIYIMFEGRSLVSVDLKKCECYRNPNYYVFDSGMQKLYHLSWLCDLSKDEVGAVTIPEDDLSFEFKLYGFQHPRLMYDRTNDAWRYDYRN